MSMPVILLCNIIKFVDFILKKNNHSDTMQTVDPGFHNAIPYDLYIPPSPLLSQPTLPDCNTDFI